MFFGALCETSPVTITDVSFRAFNMLLEYTYTDELEAFGNEDILIEVLYAARKYNIVRLVTRVERYILRPGALKKDYAILNYRQAVAYGEEKVADWCLKLIDSYGHFVINTNSVVQQFDLNVFKVLLKRDTFCAREVDIWDALIWWSKHKLPEDQRNNPQAIRAFIGDLIFLLRFPLMTMKELVQIVVPSGILQGDEIYEALRHTFPKRKQIGYTTMFSSVVRTGKKTIIIKADDIDRSAGGRFERVVSKSLRSIRMRLDHRLFLTKITLSNVPNRVTTDKFVVSFRIVDTVLSELVMNAEFTLTREPHQAAQSAVYRLDIDPVELCPKIVYEIFVTLEHPDPQTTFIKVKELPNYNHIRFQYCENSFGEERITVDELHFTT
jgi:hypothetical protein